MKTKYRIKEVNDDGVTRFYIQYKGLPERIDDSPHNNLIGVGFIIFLILLSLGAILIFLLISSLFWKNLYDDYGHDLRPFTTYDGAKKFLIEYKEKAKCYGEKRFSKKHKVIKYHNVDI